MDNRHIDITSRGDVALRLAMQLAWDDAAGGTATHYENVKLTELTKYMGEPTCWHQTEFHKNDAAGIPTLILHWNASDKTPALPFPLKLVAATEFIKEWLSTVNAGRQPDFDGDAKEGWRVFNHMPGSHYIICAVQPVWAMYGK